MAKEIVRQVTCLIRRVRSIRRKWSIGALVVAVALATTVNPAMAEPLRGDLRMFVSQYVETFNPFDIDLDGNRVSTGPLTLTLDLSRPENQTILFNFDTMTVLLHTDLFIHAPLLDVLGLPPVPIQVNESGTIELLVLEQNPGLLVAELTLTTVSSGVIGSGPLQGFAYAAPKRRPACNPRPCPGWVMAIGVGAGGNAVSGQSLGHDFLDAITDGILTSPDFLQEIAIVGERHGEISDAPAAVPEPSPFFLMLSGLAIGVANLLRRSARRSSSAGLAA